MPDTFIQFNIIDTTTNTCSLTGYANELYKFKFEVNKNSIPENISDTIFIWEFGDGEFSQELSPTHQYKAPGDYKIKLTPFGIDTDNKYKSFNNKFSQTLHIYNYVPNINYNTYGDVILDFSIVSNNFNDNINDWIKSQNVEFAVSVFNSWQSYEYTQGIYKLNLEVFKSQYPLLKVEDYNQYPYLHLSPTDKFLDNDFQPITQITLSSQKIFGTRLKTGEIVEVEEQQGSVFLGTISTGHFYYNGIPTDNLSTNTILKINFDTTNWREPYEIINNSNTIYKNPILITKPCEINFINYFNLSEIETNNVSGLININGINEDKFKIYKFKYQYTPINFVFRYGYIYNDNLNNAIIINNLSCNNNDLYYNDNKVGTIYLKDSNDNNISSIFYMDMPTFPYPYNNEKGGYLKGILSAFSSSPSAYIDITLNQNLFTSEPLSSPINIKSNFFEILSTNEIDIRKINEDFNMFEYASHNMLQTNLKDNDNLNIYLSSIMGDVSDPCNLNVKIYEKISNYVGNIEDIDTCNINNLYDFYTSFGFDIVDVNYNWPPNFRRIIDLISIPCYKLLGKTNNYNLDFDDKGYVSNKTYGKNKGKLIDFSTYIVSSNKNIIAHEKFSNEFHLINTNLIVNLENTPISVLNTIYNELSTNNDGIFMYPLSNIKIDTNNTISGYGWGWNLVVPNSESISTFYDFYEYVDYRPSENVGNIIDWDNKYNNISKNNVSSLEKWENTKEKYILQNLYKNILI